MGVLAASDTAAALLAGGSALLVVLLVRLVLHISRPQLKVDVGVRGWLKLERPPEVTAEQQAERESDA